jgi:hypothetical protein
MPALGSQWNIGSEEPITILLNAHPHVSNKYWPFWEHDLRVPIAGMCLQGWKNENRSCSGDLAGFCKSNVRGAGIDWHRTQHVYVHVLAVYGLQETRLVYDIVL